jgi:hypothetical protein
MNGVSLNDERHETIITFRNKRREYLKEKSNELETNSKNKHMKDIEEYMNLNMVTNLELT